MTAPQDDAEPAVDLDLPLEHLPLEADPADAADQAVVVEWDEEDGR